MRAMEYETVVGLEVHCQLATRTKLFCGATMRFGEEPNTQVDAVTLGLPGVLPVINDGAIDLAVRAALALDGAIQRHSTFERKHYFYPDLPKGYQITQNVDPYCVGGAVLIDDEAGGTRAIPLVRIHLEEDAGKLVHQERGPWSEVDLNRAGTPLIEIVSQPALRSGAEAYAYLLELRRALTFAGVSDCEMQEGRLRCDANVSIRPRGQEVFGTRVEIKNLNSFRAVEAAIEQEAAMQIALHRAGRYAEVVQMTKLWDPDAKTTRPMRSKEQAADYRYFPDPDLPPIDIAPERVAAIRAALPERPRDRAARYVREWGLDPAAARELTGDKAVSDYVDALVAAGAKPKLAANWTREEALRLMAETGKPIQEAAPLAVIGGIIRLIDGGKVARVVAKAACAELCASGEDPEAYFTRQGQIQVQDAGQLAAWVAQAIAQEAKAVADVRSGKLAAAGRLVGATMKLSGGKGDPAAARAEIARQLGVSL